MSIFEKVLKELGWEDGFQIPVANTENKLLEEQVAQFTLQRIKAKNNNENLNQKLEYLENHLKNVQQEEVETQKLITIYTQYVDNEKSTYKVKEHENNKIAQEIRNFNKEINAIDDRHKVQKENVLKRLRKLEKLKTETSWDVEALKTWEEELRKKVDNNDLIKKFSQQDQLRYNELEAKRAALELEYARKRDLIAYMSSEISKYETILERTGQDLKAQLSERDALMERWRESVAILHQRDESIQRIEKQLLEVQMLIEKQAEKLDEQVKFYKNERKNNEEMLRENDRIKFYIGKMKQEIVELQHTVLTLQSEAEQMRRHVTTIANTLSKERKQCQLFNEAIEPKEILILKLKQICDKLLYKLDRSKETSISSNDRYLQIERIFKFENKATITMNRTMETLEFTRYRALQELIELQNIGKLCEHDLTTLSTTIKNVRKQNKLKTEDIQKHKTIIYKSEYMIDEIQWKLIKMEEVGDDEQEEEWLNKIEKLEEDMTAASQERSLLKDQVTKVQHDIKALHTQIMSDKDKLQAMESKLHTLLLEAEGGQKHIESEKNQYQHFQVEESVLTLRHNQLEKALKQEDKTIYSMEKYRLNLEQAMMEHLLEVNSNRDILQVKRRILMEDRGRIRGDFAEREVRLRQFKTKYDVVMMTLGKDEEGQPLTITHVKIKAAQEKYLMKQQGDELDRKIQKAEQEIVAMENTLKVVNLTNKAFKKSLGAIDDFGNEMEEMKELENQLREVNGHLKMQKKNLTDEKEELENMKLKYDSLQDRKQEMEEELCRLEDSVINMEKDYLSKEEKVLRTENYLRVMKRKLSKMDLDKYERDFEIRQLKDANNNAMKNLMILEGDYKEIQPFLKKFAELHSICSIFKFPQKPFSISSSSSSTSKSSFTLKCGLLPPPPLKALPSVASTVSTLSKVDLTLNI